MDWHLKHAGDLQRLWDYVEAHHEQHGISPLEEHMPQADDIDREYYLDTIGA